MTSTTSSLLNITVNRNRYDVPPAHHVTTAPTQSWSSYLTNWTSSSSSATQNDQRLSKKLRSRNTSRERDVGGGGTGISRSSTGTTTNTTTSSVDDGMNQYRNSNRQRVGFQNPWPSWYKPTRKQVWDALEWGEDQDPCIQLAASRAAAVGDKPDDGLSLKSGSFISSSSSSASSKRRGPIRPVEPPPKTRAQLAAELLQVQQPDFAFDPSSTHRAKTTWLGHAGILVQLAPLKAGERPLRCVFDPMFSIRSSPSQMAGPIRSYPPPCPLESLPPIDVYMLSHNHHDHLDFDTVVRLWKLNRDHGIRFLVPLGNKAWFVAECGIDDDRVVELDWWESVMFSSKTETVTESESDSESLIVTCTPSQHNSGRTGFDANMSLWASWYLSRTSSDTGSSYKVYFAGDTGFQFHPSVPAWPPAPFISEDGSLDLDLSQKTHQNDNDVESSYSSCPAFSEIASKLGPPDLSFLPVSVGATFSFLRSYIPLPDALSPVPRHGLGLTGANHMPPWDAVKVFKLMTSATAAAEAAESEVKREGKGRGEERKAKRPVAVAMHWGTFVPERSEVLKILGQLEYACLRQDVEFARLLEDDDDDDNNDNNDKKQQGQGQENGKGVFVALNHGQSVLT